MQRFESQLDQSRPLARVAIGLGAVLALCWLAGCGSGVGPATQMATTTPSPIVQTYFAPYVYQIPGEQAPLTYTFDDVKGAFSQTTYQPQTQPGPQVLNAGTLAVGQRGLRSLGITAAYTYDTFVSPSAYEPKTYPAPGLPGSFVVELAGQTGGLVQMLNQPVQPLVAATQCPSFSSAQTYQFVTTPAPASNQLDTGTPPNKPLIYQPIDTWNPTTDTAYGSVDIVSSGSAVTFQNIHQYTLSSGSPPQAPSSSTPITGACGPTFFGNITNVPGQLIVTDPGGISESNPPQALVGIGSTNLLVEDNGQTTQGFLPASSPTLPALPYNNVLGAGTGAVGLPKPSSQLATSAVVGAQYLGFIYEAGVGATPTSKAVPFSSNLASFGVYSSASSGCPSVKTSTPAAVIYGGDFNPATSSNSNCDFAIDLGPQDTSNNGLYPEAKVWLGPTYPGYSTGITYPFSAVAISGQLGNQYAIFVIGFDSTQPWAIYLLQSNN